MLALSRWSSCRFDALSCITIQHHPKQTARKCDVPLQAMISDQSVQKKNKIWATDTEKAEKFQGFGKENGLGWLITALFIMGDIAGGGIVALPGAMMQMDFYPGLAMVLIMGVTTTFTSSVLGQGWVILQRRWPEYRGHCRKPYPEMAYRAMGPVAKHIVSASIALTQFMTAVVFLLLSSKNIGDFLNAFFGLQFSYCYLIIIVGIALLPLLFLKSPQDFWWAVVGAMVTTTVALVLVILGAGLDHSTCAAERSTNQKFVVTNYLLGAGTVLFSYGGHAAFPNIVNDMSNPSQFTLSSIIAFGAVSCMYVPVSTAGFITYGNAMQESIINSLQITWIQQAVNILITLHCLLALTIIFNPLNQEAEEILHVPHRFGWQRAAVRTGIMIGVIFVAESIPNFGPLLNIVGGSTLTVTSVIFPALFHLFLAYDNDKSLKETEKGTESDPDQRSSIYEVLTKSPKIRLLVCSFVVIFGALGGAAATFSAVGELVTTKFTMPCYLQPFMDASENPKLTTNLNCCGQWQNITKTGNASHCSPFQDFYNQYHP